MKPTSAKNILLTVGLVIGQHCHSQGFANLDYEQAQVVIDPGIGVYADSAIPSWTVYIGSFSVSSMAYNGQSLGGAVVSLQDSNAHMYGPIQGNYSVLLQGSTVSTPTTAAIGQTGTIPIGTQSLTFFSSYYGTLQVTFNGLPIDYLVTGTTANYDIYSADISTYAGQTGQLLFTAAVNSSALLDNIQFSSSPVPEPSVFALTALGGLLLAFRRWKKSTQT